MPTNPANRRNAGRARQFRSHDGHHFDHYGDPDVLILSEQPEPKIGSGEALVLFRSAIENPVDWKVVAGYLNGLMNVRSRRYPPGASPSE